MIKREKVMRGLESCLRFCHDGCCTKECPYISDGRCYETIKRDALALLKEQEPRVLTLEEAVASEDLVWAEFQSIHTGWENRLSLELVKVCKTANFPNAFTLTTDSGIAWLRNRCDYNSGIWFGINSGWRCWTSRPSPEQMRETPWEGDSDD